MSNDENSNETEESGNKTEAVSNAVSNEKSASKTEAASNAVGNVVSKILELKESNPKVFFGALGGLVLIIIILMMSGGDSKKTLHVVKVANVSIGQTYELRAMNSYDPKSTVRLVAIPGSMAAYDDTESEDRVGGCRHMPQGTKVKVTQMQEAFGSTKFVQVEMIAGECAGQRGWTLVNNIK